MPSNQVSRIRRQMLDEMGEQAVFDKYLEVGSVRGLAAELWEVHGEGKNPSPRYLYEWLHEVPGRWDRWQKVLRMRGDMEFDRVGELADEMDETNYRSKKAEADIRQWVAQRLNSKYSQRVNHDVSGTVEHKWLDALKEAESEEIPEAEYEMIEDNSEESAA